MLGSVKKSSRAQSVTPLVFLLHKTETLPDLIETFAADFLKECNGNTKSEFLLNRYPGQIVTAGKGIFCKGTGF